MAQVNLNDLLKSFSVPEKDKWIETASREIDGKNPMEALKWETSDRIPGIPYYDHQDLPSSKVNYQLKPSANPFLGARAWTNLPRVTVRKQIDCNPIIINHLLNGADGVLLELKHCKTLSFEKILKGVEPQYCTLGLKLNKTQSDLALNYFSHIKKNKIGNDQLTGFLLWENIPSDINRIFNQVKIYSGIRSVVIHSSASNAIAEIVDLLNQGVSMVETLRAKNKLHEIFGAIGFSVGTSTHLFEDIAKLRSLRYLWNQVAMVYEVSGIETFMHGYSNAWLVKDFMPHGNMLKSTTAALASICGGCDALTVLPENEDDVTMNRIARNVSNILREESHLNKVADPMAGSYFIDALTHKFAQAAWTQFQNEQR